MTKINPFAPNSPVHSGMFVGRVSELERLERVLIQTKAGNPTSFMITGERGIGKSSLLNYIKDVAEGMEGIAETMVSFLVIDTDVDRSTTQLGLARKLELGLDRALGKSEPARSFLRQSLGFLKRVEAAGVKLRSDEQKQSDEVLLEEFAYALADVVNRVCGPGEADLFGARFDGILVLIDEADNASPYLNLGSFFKLLTERLQRRGCSRIAVGLAGLPELRTVLAESHRSSLRLFEELILGRLSTAEVQQVVDLGLSRANATNAQQTVITAEAKNHLAFYSEGYPHFIQQFAYSAFAVDSDDVIDEEDVRRGGFARRGAMELIGDRYYRDDFYNKIQKESYRQVLRIMAAKVDGWVTKKEIKSLFKGPDTTLDNALFALRDRKIILAKEGERGVYRLQHKGFAWWIRLYTADPGAPEKTPP